MLLNNVTNILTIYGKGEDVKELLSTVLTKGDFLLKNIIAMPEVIYHTTSPSRVVSQANYDEWKEDTDGKFVLFDSAPITHEMQTELFFEYGVDNWKDWAEKYWGCIHDTLDTIILDNKTIKFDTADASPFNALIKLSLMFPRVILKIQYADEDLGTNVGSYRLENGEILTNDQPKMSSLDAYSMAMDITGDMFYIEEFLYDLTESDAEQEFPEMLIELAYIKRKLSKKLPNFILEEFRVLAVEEEDYEFASAVKEAIEDKIIKI